MRDAKLWFVSALTSAAMPIAAHADDQVSAKAENGAPFAKVIIDIVPEACGRLGCEMVISGVSSAGKQTDITFTEIMSNGILGSNAEVFGTNDATGMPQIVLQQGLVNGGDAFNLFAYKPALRRYAFVRKVTGYADGKISTAPVVQAAPAPASQGAAMAQALWNGTFSFPEGSAARCVKDAEQITKKTRLDEAEDWKGLIAATAAEGCGSDLAYYYIGRAFFKLRRPDIAAIYLRRSVEIARDKTSPKELVCRRNWCGMDIGRMAAETLVTVGKVTSGQLVYSDPAPQDAAVPTEPAVINSGVWSLGRARFLVEPRGGCPPEIALGTKSYCFSQAMDWLRRHADKQSVDVVAMQASWAPGSFVAHANGYGWNIYKVSKQGDRFTAQKQSHYGTKVQVPQGCIYAGVNEQAWYIGFSRHGKVAIEAANYNCQNPWAGQPIYTGYLNTADIDGAPGEIQIATAPMQTGQGQSYGQSAYAQPSQASPSSPLGADYGGPPQRSDFLYGTSAEIYGEPDTGVTKPKAKKK